MGVISHNDSCMKLYIKRSLILASVVFATHLTVVPSSMAQSDPPVIESEEVIAADPLDSLPGDAQLATPSYGAGFIPYISEELIEDRLNCLQNEINLEYNHTIQSFIEFFVVRKRDYTKMVLGRKDLYFPIFEEYLKKYNLPEELKYLSVVESGLNPRVISRAKAGGLWQFMPGTGRDFRLYQDNFVDERFDPYKSTEAACKYLKQLYNLFGDWELALASYNCGPGNVRRAIRRSGNRTSFWEIYNNLPRETRSYVPQFVALTYVLNYSEDYKLHADSLERIIPFDTIQVSQHVNLEALAKQLEVPLGDLQHLNPHLKRNLVPPYLKNYPIRIPSEKLEMFTANRVAIMDSVSKTALPESSFLAMNVGYIKKKTVHKVRKGESLARIADKFNVSSYQIKTWNHLRNNKVHSGQRLTIWMEKPIAMSKQLQKMVSQQAVVTTAKAENQNAVSSEATVNINKNEATEQSSTAAAKQVFHTVRKGEALGAIANKYHVSLSELKAWNHLKGSKVRVGQRLYILKEQAVAIAVENNTSSAVVASAKDEDEYPTVEAVKVDNAPDTQKAQPIENKVVHTVLKGESLFRIADKYQVKVAQIKEWNQLEKDNVRSDQQLVIWLGETAANSVVSKEEAAQPASLAASSAKVNEQKVKVSEKQVAEVKQPVEKQEVPAASTKVHRVQKGDTLWSISKQYGNIPVEQIKKLNKLKGNELKPGQKLILS